MTQPPDPLVAELEDAISEFWIASKHLRDEFERFETAAKRVETVTQKYESDSNHAPKNT